MNAFMLIFTIVWFGESATYVVDSNMTGEDCITAMQDTLQLASAIGGIVSCEFDFAYYEELE